MQMQIVVGREYKVDAPNTSSREVWTIKRINGDEITCVGNKTPYERTFLINQLKGMHTSMETKIISESVEKIGEVMGKEMHIERIDYMPHHERRGRKPSKD